MKFENGDIIISIFDDLYLVIDDRCISLLQKSNTQQEFLIHYKDYLYTDIFRGEHE